MTAVSRAPSTKAPEGVKATTAPGRKPIAAPWWGLPDRVLFHVHVGTAPQLPEHRCPPGGCPPRPADRCRSPATPLHSLDPS